MTVTLPTDLLTGTGLRPDVLEWFDELGVQPVLKNGVLVFEDEAVAFLFRMTWDPFAKTDEYPGQRTKM